MPGWDETENQWRYRVREPGKYNKYGSREIDDGVLQLYGRIRGTDTWEVQSIRFDREVFKTLASAKKWLKDHPKAKGSKAAAKNEITGLIEHEAKGSTAVILDGANGADMGDHVAFPASFASEGVFETPDGRKGYRSAEEVMKMVGFCNGMRIVVNHPPASPTEAHVVADLSDDAHPAIGVTAGAELAQDPIGLLKVRGQANIWKKDRKGNDLTPIIGRMEKGELNEVSIGYFFNSVPESGTFKGQAYDHLETDMNPYHLAILDGHEPQCASPVCGIGVTSRTSFTDENGGNGMSPPPADPPPGGQETPPAPAPAPAPAPGPAAEPISVKDMSLCALAEKNEKVKELVKKKSDLEEAKKEGDEAKAELEAIKEEERKKKLEAIKEHLGDEKFTEVFGEKPEEKSEDFIEGFFKTVPTEEEETEAEGGTASKPGKVHKDLKVPRGANKRQKVPHNEGLTVGDHCKMYGPIRLERKE